MPGDGVDPLAERLKAKLEAEIAARTTFRIVADEVDPPT